MPAGGVAMSEQSKPTVVPPHQLADPPGGQTPGMIRQQAFSTEDCWVGTATTAPGLVSGWHHHDGFTTYVFVQSGLVRLEFGQEGVEAVDAGPGAFVRIPAHVVHRESNPGSDPAAVVLFRLGSGVPVVNVNGPGGAA
jgi:uncharacterized RmlC-like cupin family protein